MNEVKFTDKLNWKAFIKELIIWCFSFIISNVVNLLAFPLAPVIALFSLKDDEKSIPKIFHWWLTDDNPIDGDEGHWLRHPEDGKTFTKFKRRTAWLWRNKGYTFDTKYLSRKIGSVFFVKGKTEVGDTPVRDGYSFAVDENGVWQFYLIFKYPFAKGKCLRLRFGWKIRLPLNDTSINREQMIATSIGLWKSYTEE